MTLNQQIAAILATRTKTPLMDTLELRQQLRQVNMDAAECWYQYLTPGDYFPAGGLWFSYQDWCRPAPGHNSQASPDNVAYMLDNNGRLPGDPEEEDD